MGWYHVETPPKNRVQCDPVSKILLYEAMHEVEGHAFRGPRSLGALRIKWLAQVVANLRGSKPKFACPAPKVGKTLILRLAVTFSLLSGW